MLTVGGAQQGAVRLLTNGGRDAARVTSSSANKRLAVLYLSVCWLRLRIARLVMGFFGGTGLLAHLFVWLVCSARALLPSDQLDGRSFVWRRDAPWVSRVRRSAVPDMSPNTDGTCHQPMAFQDILKNETHPVRLSEMHWLGEASL